MKPCPFILCIFFTRKVCINCRCGKAEHNVVEESDPGFYFVGKIFDRPLRTIAEECTFIYGEVVEEPGTGEQGGDKHLSERGEQTNCKVFLFLFQPRRRLFSTGFPPASPRPSPLNTCGVFPPNIFPSLAATEPRGGKGR